MSLPPISFSGIEVEWQFDAPDLEAVERWLRSQPAHAALAFVPGDEKVQVDEYMDSEDWRVYRAGYTLRVRRSDGRAEATMKAFSTDAEGPRRRLEVNQPLLNEHAAPQDASGIVSDRLALLLGSRPLRPLFTIETRRRPFRVQQDTETLAVVTLDEARVRDSSDPQPLRRVEVEEASPGALARVGQFVDAMRAEAGLQLATQSKFQAGLRAVGLQPDLTFGVGPFEAGAGATAAEFGFATLRRYFADLLRHEPGTRLGEDAEELHQMRVATRRLRAAMSTFEDVLPAELYALREELRWVAGALGEVRDLDVHIESLTTAQSEAAWDEGTALGPLIERMHAQRIGARTRLLEVLDNGRYDALIEQMTSRLRLGPASNEGQPGPAAMPVQTFAAAVIRSRYRRFRREARELTRDSQPEAYHAVRIRGKRLRYSVEFFAELYGQPAARFVGAIKSTQDLLGEHQDSDVAIAWLRNLVGEQGHGLPPDTLFVMGQLVERHRARMRELREEWPASFKLIRRRWKRLRQALDQASPSGQHLALPHNSSGAVANRGMQYRLRLPGFSRRARAEVTPAAADEAR